MRALLDTHAFLWFILDDPQMGEAASALIRDPETLVRVGPASYWEIAIKVSLGKYQLPGASLGDFFDESIARNRFDVLPIRTTHAATVAALPFHHRDPFDRLLIAQAILEEIPILSVDSAFDAYPIRRIW